MSVIVVFLVVDLCRVYCLSSRIFTDNGISHPESYRTMVFIYWLCEKKRKICVSSWTHICMIRDGCIKVHNRRELWLSFTMFYRFGIKSYNTLSNYNDRKTNVKIFGILIQCLCLNDVTPYFDRLYYVWFYILQ